MISSIPPHTEPLVLEGDFCVFPTSDVSVCGEDSTHDVACHSLCQRHKDIVLAVLAWRDSK